MPSLNIPSRRDVNVALKALDIRDDYEKELIRTVCAEDRRKAPAHRWAWCKKWAPWIGTFAAFAVLLGVIGYGFAWVLEKVISF